MGEPVLVGDWALPCIRRCFGLSPRGSQRLADFLRGSELAPDVLAELMMSARTRLAKKALQMLEDHGWIVPLPEGTVVRGSARSKAWKVVR